MNLNILKSLMYWMDSLDFGISTNKFYNRFDMDILDSNNIFYNGVNTAIVLFSDVGSYEDSQNRRRIATAEINIVSNKFININTVTETIFNYLLRHKKKIPFYDFTGINDPLSVAPAETGQKIRVTRFSGTSGIIRINTYLSKRIEIQYEEVNEK